MARFPRSSPPSRPPHAAWRLLRPNGLSELKRNPAAAEIPAAAKNQAVAEGLWEQSEQFTGTTFASLVSLTRADAS